MHNRMKEALVLLGKHAARRRAAAVGQAVASRDRSHSRRADEGGAARGRRAQRRLKLARIISGGQTGVDLAALDAAIAAGFPCGGWIPRGRFNEDGPIDPRYPVTETTSRKLALRTEWNVRIPTRR